MAFIDGMRTDSHHSYKYDSETIIYPEQVKALKDIKLERVADKFWRIVRESDGDFGEACNAIRYDLSPQELQSDDFAHILHKRRPVGKSK